MDQGVHTREEYCLLDLKCAKLTVLPTNVSGVVSVARTPKKYWIDGLPRAAGLALCALLFLTAWSCKSSRAGDFPEERPAEFHLVYNDSAGMLYYFKELQIDASAGQTTGSYTVTYQGEVSSVPVALTDDELDAIYCVLRENRFDDIETREEETLDRGGVSISIGIRERSLTVMNSGFFFIEDDWAAEWAAITGAIEAIISQQIEAQAVAVELSFDETVHGLDVYVKRNEDNVFSGIVAPDTAVTLEQIPGDYVFTVGQAPGNGGSAPVTAWYGPVSMADGAKLEVVSAEGSLRILTE